MGSSDQMSSEDRQDLRIGGYVHINELQPACGGVINNDKVLPAAFMLVEGGRIADNDVCFPHSADNSRVVF